MPHHEDRQRKRLDYRLPRAAVHRVGDLARTGQCQGQVVELEVIVCYVTCTRVPSYQTTCAKKVAATKYFQTILHPSQLKHTA